MGYRLWGIQITLSKFLTESPIFTGFFHIYIPVLTSLNMIRYFCDVCGQEIPPMSHPERLIVSTEQIPTNRNMVPTMKLHNDILVCAECRCFLVTIFDVEIERREMKIHKRKRTQAND